jgi:hypothetical protein
MTFFASVPTLASYKRVKPLTSLDSFGSELIRKGTSSPYSHSEIIVGNTWYSASIQDGGCVRSKLIDYIPEHWDILPLPWASPESVLLFFAETEGQPYGYRELLLRQVLRLHVDLNGWICSGWCAAALMFPSADEWYPGQLHEMCCRVNQIVAKMGSVVDGAQR